MFFFGFLIVLKPWAFEKLPPGWKFSETPRSFLDWTLFSLFYVRLCARLLFVGFWLANISVLWLYCYCYIAACSWQCLISVWHFHIDGRSWKQKWKKYLLEKNTYIHVDVTPYFYFERLRRFFGLAILAPPVSLVWLFVSNFVSNCVLLPP